jgi:hypothetical protein
MLIEKVLGISTFILGAITLFYSLGVLEAIGVCVALAWVVVFMYVSFKTSKLSFMVSTLTISTVLIILLVPSLSIIVVSLFMPFSSLLKLILAGLFLTATVMYAIDVIHILRNIEKVL